MEMKLLVAYLQKKHLILKQLYEISPKILGSRKKLSLFWGIDLKSYYTIVIVIAKKSRVVRKEAEEIIALHAMLEKYQTIHIPKKYLILDAPLCSKAKAIFEENGWKVWEESIDVL